MRNLHFGDNLGVLRKYIAKDSIDLVYLDPPFNSKRDYSILFKTPAGHESDAQITAFEVRKQRLSRYVFPQKTVGIALSFKGLQGCRIPANLF